MTDTRPASETTPNDVVIVGAGHAGLCVVSALRRRGVDPLVFDGAERLGDSWRARYDGLRLNTERSVSAIPRTKVADSVGRWPERDEWAEHIESAADQLGVERVRARIDRIRADGSLWRLETSGGVPQRAFVARVVVVATGRNRIPVVPVWEGADASPIEVLHAAHYRSPSRFVGRRVLVVGAGNSGTEIAHLLAQAGVDVTLSMRTRPVWARRELFGTTLSRLARAGRRAPSWLVDLGGRAMQPLLFGRLRPYGLGPPQRRLSRVDEASGATLDSGFIDDVKVGRIRVVSAVRRFEGVQVALDDGVRVPADVVIAATGYRPGLEAVLPTDVLDSSGWPVAGEAPFEQAPGLFTAGLNPATLTAFHPDFITEADDIADAIVSLLGR